MLSLFFLSACTEKKEPEDNTPKIVSEIDVTNYELWHYFSFEKGLLGSYTENGFDYKNNLDWDLAFHRWDIRTNGGKSGKGLGGAKIMTYGGDSNFVSDELIKTYMKAPVMTTNSMADQRVDVPANTVLAGWLKVKMSSIPPTYELSEDPFLVRGAKGDVYIINFTNYMNSKAEKGYISFNYVKL